MDFIKSADLVALVSDGTLIIDTRPLAQVADIAIADALYIPWGENFLKTFQLLIADDSKVLLVAEENEATNIHRTILASGFTGLKGMVSASETEALKKTVIITIEPDEFAIDFNHDEFYLVDARNNEEFEQEHLEWAENIPMEDAEALIQELSDDMRIYIVAANADDAVTTASIFKQNGFELVRAVIGNYEDFKNLKLPIVKAPKATTKQP
jgi:hydroxyacylglutathione hydrolase